MCVFMYIIFCDTRAPKQQQVEKSFLPLLTLDCHYSLGSLFMFFVILLFFSLSPHPVFFALGPLGRARGGTTWPPAAEGKWAQVASPPARTGADTCLRPLQAAWAQIKRCCHLDNEKCFFGDRGELNFVRRRRRSRFALSRGPILFNLI